MRVMAEHSVEGSSQLNASQAQSKRTKWNVIKTMILVSVAFVFCWLPNNILSMVILSSGQTATLAVAYYVTVFLIYLNISMNPFIYALKHEGVKQQLAGLGVCCKRRHVGDATAGSSNQAVGETKQARTGTTHS